MKIRFQTLQDSLRAGIWARLDRGELTGKSLAHKAGFQQAHLSNFLNGKRGLSLPAMDRLLDALHLDVLQLAGVNQAERYAADGRHSSHQTEAVALVTFAVAARTARFSADDIQDVVSFPQSFLRRLKPKTIGNRRDWTRFAVTTIDEQSAAGMSPQLRPGAQVLIDRHYNAPTRGDTVCPDLYAVISGAQASITRVTLTPGLLILRTLDEAEGPRKRLITIPPERRAGDLIVGRVRHISMEV
jgi:transcriptional regulator with XRE-family HTH domain